MKFKWSVYGVEGGDDNIFEADSYGEAYAKVLGWSGVCVEEVKK